MTHTATHVPPSTQATMARGHRWYAATYDLINRGAERRVLGPIRRQLLGDLAGRVLEIGAGTGANFPYYPPSVHLVATEPDPFMLRRAQQRAREIGRDLELHQAPAEALPFADQSFDAIIVTLVLCTVERPHDALAELRRVLKPDGSVRFIEHVRAEGWLGRVQDALVPAWSWWGAGCHPNRRTAATLREAGFDIVRLEERPLGPVPLIIGVAKLRSA
jgi:ubiquinone/menaquinone biosynthesis C-methylase UbiE